MLFAWDENKRAANLSKHGFDLIEARYLFDGRPIYLYASPRKGEERFVSIGLNGKDMVAAIWMRRDDTIRLISLRKARDGEKRAYRNLYG